MVAGSALACDLVRTPNPHTLAQLFSLNHDFPDAWRPFATAADDAHRVMTLAVTTDHFPYWVNILGMDDQIVATFAVIDAVKHKLSVAPPRSPSRVTRRAAGRSQSIEQAPVFAFLKK